MPAPSRTLPRFPFHTILGVVSALFFAACLDVPSSYEGGAMLDSVKLKLVLEGDTTNVLQAPVGSSFTLLAVTNPASFASELSFTWFLEGDSLGATPSYAYGDSALLPDSLLVEDEAGNSLGFSFTVVLNSAPEFLAFLTPNEGDTLTGEATDSFLFSWQATDIDGDSLTYVFEQDGTEFPAGAWSSIYASGFGEGGHSVRVIVADTHGDTDTSSALNFYVKLPEDS